MPDHSAVAVRTFGEGYNCSQAVLSAFAEAAGLPMDPALRVAAAFGGGLARTGETCGAVTGALMALGLHLASVDAADKDSKERLYGLARELMARLRSRHGSLACRDLLGCDIGTPAGWQAANDRGVFREVCPRVVADAAAQVAALLQAEGRV